MTASDVPLKSTMTSLTKLKNDKTLWRKYLNDMESVLNEYRVNERIRIKDESELDNPLLKRRQTLNSKRSPSPQQEKTRTSQVKIVLPPLEPQQSHHHHQPIESNSVESTPILRRNPSNKPAANGVMDYKSKSEPNVDELKELEEDDLF